MENIAIIGGDLRIAELAKLYSSERKVYTYGLEQCAKLYSMENIIKCNSLEELLKQTKIIITAIPVSKDGEHIDTPLGTNKILIKEFMEKTQGKLIITGKFLQKDYNSKNKIEDILKKDEFAILNALPTAEGALKLIIENSDYNLCDLNILIMGYGRIGKILANKLKKLDANVYVSARNDSDFAWIKVLGYKQIKYSFLKEEIEKFDVIVNTVPHLILKSEQICMIKPECVYIELASLPGGIDINALKKRNIKYINAQGIPGKISKIAAANIIKETINNIIKSEE